MGFGLVGPGADGSLTLRLGEVVEEKQEEARRRLKGVAD